MRFARFGVRFGTRFVRFVRFGFGFAIRFVIRFVRFGFGFAMRFVMRFGLKFAEPERTFEIFLRFAEFRTWRFRFGEPCDIG